CFLLMGLMLLGLILVLPFMVIPFIILSLSWSQAVLILLDKNYNITGCLSQSNKITYGYKCSLFFLNILVSLFLVLGYLLVILIGLGVGFLAGGGIITIVITYLFLLITVLIWIAFSLGVQGTVYKELSKRLPN